MRRKLRAHLERASCLQESAPCSCFVRRACSCLAQGSIRPCREPRFSPKRHIRPIFGFPQQRIPQILGHPQIQTGTAVATWAVSCHRSGRQSGESSHSVVPDMCSCTTTQTLSLRGLGFRVLGLGFKNPKTLKSEAEKPNLDPMILRNHSQSPTPPQPQMAVFASL